MAKNAWRRSPSTRLGEFVIAFVKQGVSDSLPLIADDFFEPADVAPPSSGTPLRMLMGVGT